jgi:cell division protein FtsZ
MREMGKAMMGTGEASGERRAIQAAEAAIANPLLDETSMKGARGLLISITGGKDLTLFEVDEAATRIREEVDPDANIILGATFEESLEGVIRVSVVATGIDSEARQEAASQEARPIDLTQRTKLAAAKPSISPRPAVPVTRPSVAAAATLAKASESPSAYNIDSQLTAAVANAAQAPQATAQASTRHADITITPTEPASARYSAAEIDADPDVPDDGEIPQEGAFIPPAAEAPPARMPRIEDFPVVGQRQLREPVAPQAHEDDRGPLSLIRRLANGFGRREDDPIGAGPQRSQPPQRQPLPQNRIQPRVSVPAGGTQPDQAKRSAPARAPTNEGMYRPRQGDLDAHGRALPGATRTSDDELEIPAFLRRQAN